MTSPRSARPGDAEAIARVHVAAWQAAYAGLVPAEELARRDVTARTALWRSLLAGRPVDGQPLPTSVLVADDGHLGVRGFLTLHVPGRDADVSADVGEVAALYVHPDRWRTGTGSALLAAGLEQASGAGARSVVLWVLTGNARARAFYAGRGFVDDGRSRSYAGVEEVRLRRGTHSG